MEFKIQHINEELRFFVNGKQVGYATYDEHGSFAMRQMQSMFENIASTSGATIKHEEAAE